MPVLFESAAQLGLHFGAEGAQVVLREGAHDVEREGSGGTLERNLATRTS